jgi:hypothetical protein
MIRSKDIAKLSEKLQEQADRNWEGMRHIDQRIDLLNAKMDQMDQLVKCVSKMTDEVLRLEAALALWQRKYEQALNKEETK